MLAVEQPLEAVDAQAGWSGGDCMTETSHTPAGIAYDRAGPSGELPVVLIHAGIADRRMWGLQWRELSAERDVVRLDLRGFGEPAVRPRGALSRR